jgi:hypothetical protein
VPKPHNSSEPKHLGFLLRSLENKLGFRLNSAARCRQAEAALQAAGYHVSYATLHRFSQQTPNAHRFYVSTLDQLATFVCQQNWEGFKKRCDRDEQFLLQVGIVGEEKVRSLLSFCIEHNQLRILRDFTEQLPIDMDVDLAIRIGSEFFFALQAHPENNREFFDAFSQIPFIRKVFFGYLADPEFRIKDYAYGLQQFVKDINIKDGQQQLQDFIFANTFLLRHAFIKNERSHLEKYGNLLYTDTEVGDSISGLSIFPRTRYECYRVLWLHNNGEVENAGDLKEELAGLLSARSNAARPFEQEAMLNILLDTYILTNTPNEQCVALINRFETLVKSLGIEKPIDPQVVLEFTDHTRVNWITMRFRK